MFAWELLNAELNIEESVIMETDQIKKTIELYSVKDSLCRKEYKK
jgi:hypothetical protein